MPLRRLFRGRKGGIERTPTLAPEQQAIMGRLAPFLQERIGRGLPAYEGEFVAPLGEYEQMGLSRLGEYLRGTPSPIFAQATGTLSDLIRRGATPEETIRWYEQYIAPEERRIMEQEVVPGIKEAMVAPGTLYGTPYTGAVGRAWEAFGAQRMGRLGEAIRAQQAMAANLLPLAHQFGLHEEELPLRQTQAAMQYGALPRLLQQADLVARFEEFKRTTPELSPVLDLAMNLLKTPTQAAFYRPATPSPFMQLLGAIAPGVGAWLGGRAATPATPSS